MVNRYLKSFFSSIKDRVLILSWVYFLAHRKKLFCSWHFCPSYWCQPKNAFVNYLMNSPIKFGEKLEKLKENLDEVSVRTISDFIEHGIFINGLNHFSMPDGFLCSNKINIPKDGRNIAEELPALYRLAVERYCLPDDANYLFEAMSSLYFHHGLRFAPQKIKDYVRNKIFIDGGAYYGESAFVFMQYDPSAIYSFDFSQKNLMEFRRALSKVNFDISPIHIFEKGLSQKNGHIVLDDVGGSGASLPLYRTLQSKDQLHKGSEIDVELVSLDEHMKVYPGTVGVIKADVEGAGLDLVKGMVDTLRKDRPFLSLCIYHNMEEFFEIKPFLEGLNLNYHFEIRRMMPSYSLDIILLGCPNELLEGHEEISFGY